MRDYGLYLFDFDGTLMRPRSGEKFPKTVDDREFIEGRWEHLIELAKSGKKTAIITNQGGAAWGIFAKEEMDAYLAKVIRNADMAAYFVCYHDHREKARSKASSPSELLTVDMYKEWYRRKPGPGMLMEAMDYFGVSREETLMVGDRNEDRLAAEAAGTSFEWSWDYFKEGPIMA